MSPRWRVDAGTRLVLVIPIALLVVLGTAGMLWFAFGAHRDSPRRVSAMAARNGLLVEAESREEGWFSSSWRGVKLLLRGASGVTVDIDRMYFRHWPFVASRMTVAHAHIRLRGELVPLLATIRQALRVDLGEVVVENLAVTYEHRVLGSIVLDGATLHGRGAFLLVEAKRARVGAFDWPDARFAIESRKDMFVIGWGGEGASARLQLSCFPPAGGVARWLFDVLHQPVRPLLVRLGWDLGEELDGTRLAGGISLDVPEDPAQPPHGRVQLVLDGWPLDAPTGSQTLLGGTLSILSNLVPAAGSRWELPRVEITMPVFSLVGKGHIELGPRPTLALAAEGERSCRELRALLPPSAEREVVARFLAAPSALSTRTAMPPPARLGLKVRAGAGGGYRSEWDFRPACGLRPWEEQQQ